MSSAAPSRSTKKRTPNGKEKRTEEGTVLKQTNISFAPVQKRPRTDKVDKPAKEILIGGMKSTRNKGPSLSSKKLTIKMTAKPTLPPDFKTKTWEKLKETVLAVFEERPFSYVKEELYRDVENMCIHRFDEYLLENLNALLQHHIKAEVDFLKGRTNEVDAFLRLANDQQQRHTEKMGIIRSIFLYLDRRRLQDQQSAPSLYDIGLQHFRDYLTASKELIDKLSDCILQTITRERKGEAVDRTILRNLIRFLSSLKLYERYIETPFMKRTSGFFEQEGQQKVLALSVSEYLVFVENSISEESRRVDHYLEPRTAVPLLSCLNEHLIAAHVASIIERGFEPFVEADRLDDLRRLFTLLKRVNALDKIKDSMTAYIRKVGEAIVNDKEKEKEMVPSLLDLKSKFEGIVEQCFENDGSFHAAISNAFELFINTRQNKPAELLAKYIDSLLKTGGSKGMTEGEVESKLDKALIIFKFVRGKDVFEAFYKKDLAKRLLLNKSASFDAEKAMLLKLKEECGSAFTAKLEGMFKDMELSTDIMADYKSFLDSLDAADTEEGGEVEGKKLKKSKKPRIDMFVNVLTTGFWPPYVPSNVILPSSLSKCQELFQTFYLQKHNGRKLVWQNTLGHCIVVAQFPKMKGNRELIVSLHQTVVLMLFNDSDSLSFKDIVAATGLEKGEAERTVQSLAMGKVKVLKRKTTEKGKDLKDEDDIVFNTDFVSAQRRIKINTIQIKETKEEADATTERVLEDRLHQIDAAVVRTMKARKQLKHQTLIGEVSTQLRFPVKATDIKKRIESLIEREYLERDEDDKNIYKYLA